MIPELDDTIMSVALPCLLQSADVVVELIGILCKNVSVLFKILKEVFDVDSIIVYQQLFGVFQQSCLAASEPVGS